MTADGRDEPGRYIKASFFCSGRAQLGRFCVQASVAARFAGIGGHGELDDNVTGKEALRGYKAADGRYRPGRYIKASFFGRPGPARPLHRGIVLL